MAQQIIDVGNVANDGTGDPLRTAFQIINDNFNEVYSPSSIANGSSRIDIAQDGDIYMTSNGVANVVVVSSTQVTITGDLAVTGNAILSGNIIGDRIQNGDTIIDIQAPGANANVSVGGVQNIAVFATTGEYVNGLLSVSGSITGDSLNVDNTISAAGNAVVGNISTAGLISAAGNITGGNVLTTRVSATTVSGTSLVGTTVSATANVTGGNILTGGLISAAGNITGGNIVTSGSFLASSYSATGNVTAGNILSLGIVSAAGNGIFSNLVIGSGNTGNAIIYGNLTVYGNTTTINSNTITTNDLNITVGNNQNTGPALNNAGLDVGNNNLATWRYNDATTSWQSNLTITPSANATLNLGGTSNYWNNAYLNNVSVAGVVTTNSMTATGNVVGGNVRTSGQISAAGNITGGNIIATNIGNVAALNFDGNVSNVLLGSGVFGNNPATLGALNYAQNSVSSSTTVTTADSFPVTVASLSLFTNGNPVQVIVTGDVNPLAAGNGKLQLYRDSTAIGQPVWYEASAANENSPYALQVIDAPIYGTYTYSLKVVSLTANTQFGETNGPVLSAVEIQNVRGYAGAPFAWRTVNANGTSIISNVSEGTISYLSGNNLVITGNATSNVATFAVADAPSFSGNVSGANFLTGGQVSAAGNVTGSNVNATTASVTGNATIGNANIGSYTTNALRVNGTGYIINSATTDPYPNTGTLDVAAVTQPNVVIRAFSQTTSSTSGPVVQFVRKQQTGTALSSGLDAGRMKFWAIQPNNDVYNYIGEVVGITSGSGTDGKLELYTGLANVPQLVLTLNSDKQANFTGAINTSGNITGGNVLFGSGVVSGTGNITGGNVSATNHTGTTVSITGNATAGYFIGDGSQLTNINAGNITGAYGNSNVAGFMAAFGSNTISTTGNITGGNIIFGSGVVSGTGAITGGNITGGNLFFGSGVVSGTGNITGGNVATGGTVSATSTITGGNLATGGTVSAGGNITGGNVLFGSGVVSGTGNITGGNLLAGSGVVSTSGNITGGNVLFGSGVVSGTGNITGGNLLAGSGVVSTSGNISAGYFIGDGSQLTNINAGNITGAYGNSNVAGFMAAFGSNSISTSGNVTSGNIITGVVSTDSITKTGSNGVGNIGSASNYFNYVFATATTALYADLAEKYLADQNYVPGTVLSFGGAEEVTISSQDSDSRIIGVVSSNPSYIMNSGLEGRHVVTIALQGRVPCLVQGPVRKGDMMVSAGNGRARAENSPRIGTVIGKSLEDFDGDAGVIEVVVGRI